MQRRPLARLLALVVCLAALPVYAQDEGAAAPEETLTAEAAPEEEVEPSPVRSWFSGSLRLGLDFAAESGETDIVLDQILRLDIEPPKYERFRVKASLWLTEDLDGHEPAGSALGGIINSYGSAVQARLLHLYAEWDDTWGDSTLRLGRQRITDSPAYSRIDGLYFKQLNDQWEWYAFAGARASVYSSAHDDFTAGAGVSIWVRPGTRLSLDSYYSEDERRGGRSVEPNIWGRLLRIRYPRGVQEDVDSRRIDFSVYQYLGDRHRFFGRYTWYDGRSDEVALSLSGVLQGREITYDLTYRQRLYLLEDRSNDVTGFFRILGPQEAYRDLRAVVDIPLSTRFSLGLEGQIHDAENDSGRTANRDFDRMAAFVHATELVKNMDGSLGVEYWNVSGGEGSLAFNMELARRWEKSKLTAGVDFERYKDRIVAYDPSFLLASQLAAAFTSASFVSLEPLVRFFDVREVDTRENVYVFYTRYQRVLSKSQDLVIKATVEEDDGPNSPYWRLEAAYTVKF